MASARMGATQGGKPKIRSTLFSLEDEKASVHDHHRKQEDPFHVRHENVAVRPGLGWKKKTDDSELDVFSAEKYFSGDMVIDGISPKRPPPAAEKKETETSRSAVSGSPGVLWPSQEGWVLRTRRSARNWRIADVLRCGCPCSSKKSVNVERNGGNQLYSQDGRNSNVQREFKEGKNAGLRSGGFASPEGHTISTVSRNSGRNDGCEENDENVSESSSELFEIEGILTTQSPHFLPGSNLSPDTATTCYKPSEASIERSVPTASAANFSTATYYNDWLDDFPRSRKVAAARQAHRSGLFLGCTSRRAVSISSNTVELSGKAADSRPLPNEHGRESLPMRRAFGAGSRQLKEIGRSSAMG